MDLLRKGVLLFVAMGLLLTATVGAQYSSQSTTEDTIRIAVRANSGVEAAIEKWSATANALSQAISGYTFELVPMVGFDEMRTAVEEGAVDFVLTNPAAFVELETTFGVSRIVTLRNWRNGGGFAEFAGVVFTRADRTDIGTLDDIDDHSIMGVHPEAFGGWWVAVRELKDLGIDPFKDCAEVLFSPDGTHESVVRAVMSDEVDIGTVGTGILEGLVERGELNAGAVKILNRIDDDLPFPHSTRGYPEWPFATLHKTPDELAQRVAIALLSMAPDDPAAIAGDYTGWTIPLDYNRVHDLLRELRVGPYEDYGQVTLGQAFRQHLPAMLVTAIAVVVLFLFAGIVVVLNRRLRRAQADLRQHQEHLEELVKQRSGALRSERDKLKSVFAAMTDGVYIVNREYDIEYANPMLVAGHGPYEGCKCYAYLHGRKEACPWCGNPEVFTGKTVRLEWTSPKNGKTYDLINTPLTNADGLVSVLKISRDITDQKQAEEELRENHAEFRRLNSMLRLMCDNLPELIWTKDLQNRYMFANKSCCENLLDAKDVHEPVGRTDIFFAERVKQSQPQDPDYHTFGGTCAESDRAVLETKEMTKRDESGNIGGRFVVLDVIKAPFWDENGKLIGTVGCARDVTREREIENEHKWVNEALRKSETLLAETGRMAKVGGWEVDADTLDVSWTEETCRIHEVPPGYKPPLEEAIDFFHPDDRPQFETATQQAFKHGEPFDIEIRLITAKGKHLWIHAVCKPVIVDGKTFKLTGIFQDITERKRAGEERERLMSAIEQATDSIMITNIKGAIQYVNPAFEHITGHTREEVIGRNQRFLKSGEHDGAFYREMGDTLTSDQVWSGRLINKKKNGSFYTGDATISPVHDALGRTVNYVAVTRDITREMKLQAQLNQAQKMESVGRLAGGVAHDFNNMLGVILGHTELALDRMVRADPLHADLLEIRKAAERSADLTRHLLAFARKQPISPKILDPNDIVKGILQMLHRLIGEDIDLAWLPKTGVWPVKMDPSQIDRMLVNLCVNAQDAIEGVGKITIETGNVTFDDAYCDEHPGFVPGEYVLLAVSDSGCGMDKETLGSVFEPFFTTKEMGTGLGLATVYGIVKQNNGFINVYSEPGDGTTFKIYLSRHKGEAAEVEKEGPAEPGTRGEETILLVEDEIAILKLTATMLERQGYTVLAASTPDEAIRLAGQHTGEIHLLMTDVIMPGMNGQNLAKNLLSSYPELRCLFMSGYTANVIAHRGVIDEGVNFVQKPFTTQDLAAKVREVLDSE